ncbi:phosphodiester glycosidase family protein [Oscillatoria sp. FACHB-1406]|uniref:phosphodiester glycosidase family protein n=1 Tax=Oscillatoria sp. FACHB-1406 TaxID=2692846 RepID=UPI001689290A|nr:phosphodiester glycosidase family protein [Oscillatoria sp. FACHB-1406]MBD2580004.1 phosphodiester glycosidase family protein [Oscillatoria sp. FACHB-1406]
MNIFATFPHSTNQRTRLPFSLLLAALFFSSASCSLAEARNSKKQSAEASQASSNEIAPVAREIPLSAATTLPRAIPASQTLKIASTPAPAAQPPVIAQLPPQVLQQGTQISLNGKTLPVAWLRWQEGNEQHFGISDTAAAWLGIELLNSSNPDIQPVNWFSDPQTSPILLKTLFRNPYRYLDLSFLAPQSNLKWQVSGETLTLTSQPAKVVNIREGQGEGGQRFVIDLDRATFWQVDEEENTATLTFTGTADPALIQRFSAQPSSEITALGKKLESVLPFLKAKLENAEAKILKVESSGSQVTLRLKIPESKHLKVSTLPNRLIVDITANAFVERAIVWQPGVIWRSQQVSVGQNRFPVTSLELDPRSGIGLRPIWGNPEGMTGTEPLVKMGRTWQAVAAINGGFFNRNIRQPLGAVRRDGRWFSGPILHRGAIAWDDRGNVKVDRLTLQETVTTATGQRLPITHLNSGYVQAGIARYTPEWGINYTPLTDGEIVVLVQNDLVLERYPGGEHGKTAFPIPPGGYILALRSNSASFDAFAPGTPVAIDSQTFPPDFANYPQIIGAGPLLLFNRQIVLDATDEKFSAAFNQEAAPRSIIATSDRGTIVIAAIHNPPNRRGPTLAELAQLTQKLGFVNALNLDGGSSTSLFLGGHLIDRDPSTAARVHNGIGVYLPPSGQ